MATIVWGVGSRKCPRLPGSYIFRVMSLTHMDERYTLCAIIPSHPLTYVGFCTVTFLYWTPIFVGYSSQYMHHKTHVLRKGDTSSNVINNFTLNNQHNQDDICIHLGNQHTYTYDNHNYPEEFNFQSNFCWYFIIYLLSKTTLIHYFSN